MSAPPWWGEFREECVAMARETGLNEHNVRLLAEANAELGADGVLVLHLASPPLRDWLKRQLAGRWRGSIVDGEAT